jgi:adenylate cyclase
MLNQILTNLLNLQNYWIPLIFALILLVICAYLLFRYIKKRRRRNIIWQTFSHYLAPSVVNKITPDLSQIQNSIKILSILTCEIRELTAQVEGLSPEEVGRFVNFFSSLITDSIFDHEGFIDSRSISNTLAYWNAVIDDSRHAENACRAALKVSKQLNEANSIWKNNLLC